MGRNTEVYDYYHSEILGLDFAVRKDRTPADVMFEDGVVYSEEEMGRLKLSNNVKVIHSLKKIFKGEVIQ